MDYLPLKHFKKIPIYVVEEHNDALQFIYSAIGGKRLPVEGTTLVHLDAHPDMQIPRQLTGLQARSGKKLLPLLEIENWIVPAIAAGHISRVVWLRPPWAHQFKDGTQIIRVGDHPQTGLLRVDSFEPYFLSDALYSSVLKEGRTFTLTVSELGDPNGIRKNEGEHVKKLVKELNVPSPYVLDIDLDFFSTANPFLSLYDGIELYDRLENIFDFERPESQDPVCISKVVEAREKQLDELKCLFKYLECHGSLDNWPGDKTNLFVKVKELSLDVMMEAERCGVPVDWWTVHAAGCTRDQGGLPAHTSSALQIVSLVRRSLNPLLRALPPPILITVARSTEDGYCPSDQVEEIQSLVLEELRNAYDTKDPFLYYLTDS